MTARDGAPAGRRFERRYAPDDFVPLRTRAIAHPLVWFRLRAADRALVAAGDTIEPGQPLLERMREVSAREVRLERSASAPAAGEALTRTGDDGARARSGVAPDAVTRVLFEAPGRRLRVAAGRHPEIVLSPVRGRVEQVGGDGIGVRTDGSALPAAVASGESVSGRLLLAVEAPDQELRASSVDVAGAGAILVAGARLDIEALTRARATGVRGIITGGLVGKDLRALAAADARQRAALHPTAPFGLVVLEGYGRWPIPGATWECLRAAEGRDVALITDPPCVVVPGIPAVDTAEPGIRVAAGEHLGRQGRIVRVLGPVRQPSGLYHPTALVALEPAPGRPEERVAIALADLERFD